MVTALWFGNYLLYSACACKTYTASAWVISAISFMTMESATKLSNDNSYAQYNSLLKTCTHGHVVTLRAEYSLEWSLYTSCQFRAAADQLSAWYWHPCPNSCRSNTVHTVHTLHIHNPVKTAKPAEWWCRVHAATLTITELLWTMNKILHSIVWYIIFTVCKLPDSSTRINTAMTQLFNRQ